MTAEVLARINHQEQINQLATDYRRSLEAHLTESNEMVLNQAYELGRKAVGAGISLLDLSILHHKALYGLLRTYSPAMQPNIVERAAIFFSESLSPFEMLIRRYPHA